MLNKISKGLTAAKNRFEQKGQTASADNSGLKWIEPSIDKLKTFGEKIKGLGGEKETAETFRNMSREQWEGMSNKELSANVRKYRGLVLSEAKHEYKHRDKAQGHDLNKRSALIVLSSWQNMNDDPDQFPTLGGKSSNLGKEIEKSGLVHKDDAVMIGNLSRLSESRAEAYRSFKKTTEQR